ncbi:hypothetical protein ILUMI_22621 [Ignelater luminosus]|uniref:Uncharacterized protein n=1 Tax=Ignelater luminosus TaxID=2038154 RepID=A0A8K0G0D1_IGNLU|nr:hypothetical protein ILUMI_22621 [Ignelater luminosus]
MPNDVELARVMIKKLGEIPPPPPSQVGNVVPDLLWLYNKHKDLPSIAEWNGFMEEVTRDKRYQTTCTFVGCHPTTNAFTGYYDTIYIALLSAVQKIKSLGHSNV